MMVPPVMVVVMPAVMMVVPAVMMVAPEMMMVMMVLHRLHDIPCHIQARIRPTTEDIGRRRGCPAEQDADLQQER